MQGRKAKLGLEYELIRDKSVFNKKIKIKIKISYLQK